MTSRSFDFLHCPRIDGGQRVKIDALTVTSEPSITAPGPHKIVSDRSHAAGFEWLDFGYSGLAARPAWYSGSIATQTPPGTNYYLRGCQVNSGFCVLNYNVDGGFAFRPNA